MMKKNCGINLNSPFLLSFLTLAFKNATPFVITWSVARHYTTVEFNVIFTTVAAVAFVSGAGSFNLLFTAQSLYGRVNIRKDIIGIFHSIFYLRFLIFSLIGLIYFILINLNQTMTIFFTLLFSRMVFDYIYAILKITGRFRSQMVLVIINLLCVLCVAIGIPIFDLNALNVLTFLIVSDIVPIFVFAITFSNVIFSKSGNVSPKTGLTLLIPGARLLGLSIFLPLINNTIYINLFNAGYSSIAETYNFSFKIGLAFSTLFSVFSNYLIQTTDWASFTNIQISDSLKTYVVRGLLLTLIGCSLVYVTPVNQILFHQERFADLNKWTVLTTLSCCLLVSTSILNQIRVQLSLITTAEWIYWPLFTMALYSLFYLFIAYFEAPVLGFASVVTFQFISLILLVRNVLN